MESKHYFWLKALAKKYKDNEIISKLENIRKELDNEEHNS